MKNALLVIFCGAFLFLGATPRPFPAIHSRKRSAPRATAVVQVPVTGQAIDREGRTIILSGTVAISISDRAPAPIPIPNPQPNPAIQIDRVREASGAIITSAAGSSIVFIQGSGFGAGGTAKIAGQAVAVLNWLPYQLECKLPVVSTSQTGPVIVSPTGVNPGSGLAFTILASTPVPGPVPTPLPIPGPLPQLVEYPPGSGLVWSEGHIPFGRNYGPTSSFLRKP